MSLDIAPEQAKGGTGMTKTVQASLPNAACAGCGESTAAGTPFYSDRRTLPDGAYLCVLCNSKLAAARGRHALTDEEVRQLIQNGTAAAIVWGNNHI
jgi:hypothetical protein